MDFAKLLEYEPLDDRIRFARNPFYGPRYVKPNPSIRFFKYNVQVPFTASAVRTKSPLREDFEWFYSDKGRVAQYAGRRVAIKNKTIVEVNHFESAPNGSLLIDVPQQVDGGPLADLGL